MWLLYGFIAIKWQIFDDFFNVAIGKIGHWQWQPKHSRSEIGFILRRDLWRRGLATEAAGAAVAAALALPTIQLVWAYCDVDNRASARVMEKAGMRSEGVLRRWAVSRSSTGA